MQRKCRWLVPFVLLYPAICFGQMGPGALKPSISGYIRDDSNGHGVASARVDLLNAMGSPLDSTYTDGNGKYEFPEVPGDCYLVVQHDGYAQTREFVRPEGAPHVNKDVFLHPQANGSSGTAVNPISEHELSVPPAARKDFDKGIQLVVSKSDYRGAVTQFEHAISKFPTYYECYAAMGLAQQKMGDTEAAEKSWLKSIELSDSKYPQAMVELASMYNSQKRFADSEPLLRKTVAADATSWRGQYELAVALNGENRFGDAVGFATAARDLKPDNPQIYLLLYGLHVQTDNFHAAIGDIDGYLKVSPNGPMADRARKMREQILKNKPDAANEPVAASPTPHF